MGLRQGLQNLVLPRRQHRGHLFCEFLHGADFARNPKLVERKRNINVDNPVFSCEYSAVNRNTAMPKYSNPPFRYEIEWPSEVPTKDGEMDADGILWECEYRSTLKEANALARKVLHRSPMKLAYVTREHFTGRGDPKDASDHEWERDAATREEFTAN